MMAELAFRPNDFVSSIVPILGLRFGRDIADERARNIIQGLGFIEPEENPADLVVEALEVDRGVDMGQQEIRALANEIVGKLDELKFF
jgi:hypothetical protein